MIQMGRQSAEPRLRRFSPQGPRGFPYRYDQKIGMVPNRQGHTLFLTCPNDPGWQFGWPLLRVAGLYADVNAQMPEDIAGKVRLKIASDFLAIWARRLFEIAVGTERERNNMLVG